MKGTANVVWRKGSVQSPKFGAWEFVIGDGGLAENLPMTVVLDDPQYLDLDKGALLAEHEISRTVAPCCVRLHVETIYPVDLPQHIPCVYSLD